MRFKKLLKAELSAILKPLDWYDMLNPNGSRNRSVLAAFAIWRIDPALLNEVRKEHLMLHLAMKLSFHDGYF